MWDEWFQKMIVDDDTQRFEERLIFVSDAFLREGMEREEVIYALMNEAIRLASQESPSKFYHLTVCIEEQATHLRKIVQQMIMALKMKPKEQGTGTDG